MASTEVSTLLILGHCSLTSLILAKTVSSNSKLNPVSRSLFTWASCCELCSVSGLEEGREERWVSQQESPAGILWQQMPTVLLGYVIPRV